MLIISTMARLLILHRVFNSIYFSNFMVSSIYLPFNEAVMLSEEEKQFLQYWEISRDKEKKSFRQLLIGLPLGLIFTLPILLNFMSGWYKRAAMIRNSSFNPLVLIVGIILIVCFFAIFNKKHQWDMREQRYRELKVKEEKERMQRFD